MAELPNEEEEKKAQELARRLHELAREIVWEAGALDQTIFGLVRKGITEGYKLAAKEVSVEMLESTKRTLEDAIIAGRIRVPWLAVLAAGGYEVPGSYELSIEEREKLAVDRVRELLSDASVLQRAWSQRLPMQALVVVQSGAPPILGRVVGYERPGQADFGRYEIVLIDRRGRTLVSPSEVHFVIPAKNGGWPWDASPKID